jgi:hypothetical protein
MSSVAIIAKVMPRANHMKKGTIVGIAVALVAYIALIQFLPEAVCQDGWKSPSIGRHGACSHHGGVRTSILPLLVIALSIALGGILAKVLNAGGWSEFRSKNHDRNTLNSRPGQTPYGSLEEYEAHLRQLGISEEQIQLELDKYR